MHAPLQEGAQGHLLLVLLVLHLLLLLLDQHVRHEIGEKVCWRRRCHRLARWCWPIDCRRSCGPLVLEGRRAELRLWRHDIDGRQ